MNAVVIIGSPNGEKAARPMLNTGTLHERRTGFLTKARAEHGSKYQYVLANYVNNKTAIVIICRSHHRPFACTQAPHDHLKGRGCPNCGKRSGSSPASRATPFALKANRLHGGRYDYTATNYVDAHTPVVIICRNHGAFEQRPTKHLQGSGCFSCTRASSRATLRRKRAQQTQAA